MSMEKDRDFDLDRLLHPASAFEEPMNVVRDPDLTLTEKRAILASWASDACAVESAPALRQAPNGRVVTFDDVLDALRTLDAEAEKSGWAPSRRLTRALRRGRFNRQSSDGESGPSPRM
jgi:hypothetical protein